MTTFSLSASLCGSQCNREMQMISLESKIARVVTTAVAALWLVIVATGSAAAATACPPLASKAVTAVGYRSTTATSWVNAPGSTVNFVQGDSKSGCVLVFFSAEAHAVAYESMVIAARLDEATYCQPYGTYFFVPASEVDNGLAAHAANFVCSGVTPGSHVIQMQYASVTGSIVTLRDRTLIVQYIP